MAINANSLVNETGERRMRLMRPFAPSHVLLLPLAVAAALLLAQPRHPHVRTTYLERPGALEVLALEQDTLPRELAQDAARLDGRADDDALEHPCSVEDRLARDARHASPLCDAGAASSSSAAE